MIRPDDLESRPAPIDIDAGEFRVLGHQLVEEIAHHLDTIREKPVTRGMEPSRVREILSSDMDLPEDGTEARTLLQTTGRLLFEQSLFNGHPRFWGYITSSPTPIGILGDFLASALNPNVGAWKLAPLATEIELQTIRWIAQFIGYPQSAEGLLVSGGNMANFVGFLTARRAMAGEEVRTQGAGVRPGLRAYCSKETHTWIEKAADLFGHGTEAIRWIPVVGSGVMDVEALQRQVRRDRENGDQPFLVVGNAGTVATGAVDPIDEIAAFAREARIWFHVDGAYGGLAARVRGAPRALGSLAEADSVAIDPHKWLYAPLEAGCILIRKAGHLEDTFSYHPSYYHLGEEGPNFFGLGMQNSRGFRALKVWLSLRQAGAAAYRRMLADDIRLAAYLYTLLSRRPDFEVFSHNLSVTTFRYVPVRAAGTPPPDPAYLDTLNQEILGRIERGGEAFLSNAVIDGKFALRMCIVNFRTTLADIEFLPELVTRLGRECDTHHS